MKPKDDAAFKKRKFAIATATAKKAGYASFKPGSKGDAKRREIAEAIAKDAKVLGFGKKR
jgi:phage terminase small subunit